MYEAGSATGYLDLLSKLDTFLSSKGSAFAVTYAGVGTGLLSAWAGGASSVAETFTITATSSTNFTVVGSVSGSIGPATVGTTFTHAKLTFLISAGGTAFVAGDAFQLATTPKWTKLRGPAAASKTRWRINVRTTVGASPVEIGEMELMDTHGGPNLATGGTASASSGSTAANAFDGSGATRAILTGNSGWLEYQLAVAKTIIEFAITMSSATTFNSSMPKDFTLEYHDGTNWVIAGSFRNETAWAVGERRVFRLAPYTWQAPGNDGLSQILVGISPFENAGTGWYNLRLNGYTAFDASADFFDQPGGIKTTPPYGPVLPLTDSSIGYWFFSNGRRVVVITKCGSVYGAAYLGLIQPYASPGQWPYPLFVGGSLYFEDSTGEPLSTSVNWLVGTAHSRHTTFALPFVPLLGNNLLDIPTASSARLRKPDGTWRAFMARSDFYNPMTMTPSATIHPYAYGFTGMKPGLDGKYDVFPIVLFERAPDNAFGQLDGVHAITGSGLSAEALIAIGRDTYIAFSDVTRGTAGDFFAVRID